jgi:hypothetical protein
LPQVGQERELEDAFDEELPPLVRERLEVLDVLLWELE